MIIVKDYDDSSAVNMMKKQRRTCHHYQGQQVRQQRPSSAHMITSTKRQSGITPTSLSTTRSGCKYYHRCRWRFSAPLFWLMVLTFLIVAPALQIEKSSVASAGVAEDADIFTTAEYAAGNNSDADTIYLISATTQTTRILQTSSTKGHDDINSTTMVETDESNTTRTAATTTTNVTSDTDAGNVDDDSSTNDFYDIITSIYEGELEGSVTIYHVYRQGWFVVLDGQPFGEHGEHKPEWVIEGVSTDDIKEFYQKCLDNDIVNCEKHGYFLYLASLETVDVGPFIDWCSIERYHYFFIPIISGLTSFICSITLMVLIVFNKRGSTAGGGGRRRSATTTHNIETIYSSVRKQLLFGLSMCDCIGSFGYMFSTLPAPKVASEKTLIHDCYKLYHAGNITTCTLQGFLVQIGLCVPFYNAFMGIYYVLAVKYNKSDFDLLKRYGVIQCMHGFIIIWIITVQSINLSLRLYNSDGIMGCWVRKDCSKIMGYVVKRKESHSGLSSLVYFAYLCSSLRSLCAGIHNAPPVKSTGCA